MTKIKIKDFYNLIENDGGTYEILTPDGFKPIGNIYKKNNKQLYSITLDNGLYLKGSGDHLVQIYTSGVIEDDINSNIEIINNNTWLTFSNLTKNDIVVTKNGNSKPTNIIKLDRGTTYDIEILDDNHEYYSNDIVSHNCGKSAMVNLLAQSIVDKNVPILLQNKKIYSIDMASIVSGTRYRGEFEERLKEIILELEKNANIILFIDEIHTIVGAGSTSGSLDAANILKPSLTKGRLQIIGSTTLEEYRKYIEKDGSLERRFQKVIIDASTPQETLQILENIKEEYENHHIVKYTPESLKACVDLTNRYINYRSLPDKAIDALDEAGAKMNINKNVPIEIIELEQNIINIRKEKKKSIDEQDFEVAAKFRDTEKSIQLEIETIKNQWIKDSKLKRQIVTEENIAEVVSMMTGIPLQRISLDETNKLISMDEDLSKVVIGQDDAIKKISKCIRRSRSGLRNPGKPQGTFIFLGNSGCGKTHLSKMLAKFLFGSEDSMIRVDMSEYMEKHSVSKLYGAAPGYIGFDDNTGQLTEKVRRKPYSIILFDEIEKAHPDVCQTLLQVLDDGVLTDSHGRKIDFKNTIIIMTSNLGTKQLKDFGHGVGFQTTSKLNTDNSKSVINNALKKHFAPEFLNRIDEIVIFNELNRDDIHKIIDIELSYLSERLLEMGYTMKITTEAKDFIMEKGWDPDYGARPLKRAIQTYIEDILAEKVILGKLKNKFTIDYKIGKNELNFK